MSTSKLRTRIAAGAEAIPARRATAWYEIAIQTEGLSILEQCLLMSIASRYVNRRTVALSYRDLGRSVGAETTTACRWAVGRLAELGSLAIRPGAGLVEHLPAGVAAPDQPRRADRSVPRAAVLMALPFTDMTRAML